jgi:hypothetical protein
MDEVDVGMSLGRGLYTPAGILNSGFWILFPEL